MCFPHLRLCFPDVEDRPAHIVRVPVAAPYVRDALSGQDEPACWCSSGNVKRCVVHAAEHEAIRPVGCAHLEAAAIHDQPAVALCWKYIAPFCALNRSHTTHLEVTSDCCIAHNRSCESDPLRGLQRPSNYSSLRPHTFQSTPMSA